MLTTLQLFQSQVNGFYILYIILHNILGVVRFSQIIGILSQLKFSEQLAAGCNCKFALCYFWT